MADDTSLIPDWMHWVGVWSSCEEYVSMDASNNIPKTRAVCGMEVHICNILKLAPIFNIQTSKVVRSIDTGV